MDERNNADRTGLDSPATSPAPLVDPVKLARAIAQRRHVWQMDFLTAGKLAEYAGRRNVRFWERHVLQLWRLGHLRADLIIRERKARSDGWRYVSTNSDGEHVYADVRRTVPFALDPSSDDPILPEVAGMVTPYFHPFRFYVLQNLAGILEFNPLPSQTLVPSARFHDLLDRHLADLDRYVRSGGLVELIDQWNDVASLAIISEPTMYTTLFGVMRKPVQISEEDRRTQVADHWLVVKSVYEAIGLGYIERQRENLCWATRQIEPNEDVHTLLCLSGREYRLKLEGRLGAALVVRTMTEIIRRSAERAFDTQLPEEDVHPARLGMQRVKQNRYGSQRLLGDDWRAADEFARTFGLRFGPYIRWYVEGTTEHFAAHRLREVFGLHDVGIVNLRGLIGNKGNSFAAIREHLVADGDARIFSLISLDGDVGANVKVLRIAARDDIFCGAFVVSRPCFECRNFSKDELEEIVWAIALDNGADSADYEKYKLDVSEWDYDRGDVDDLLRRAERTLQLFQVFGKGKARGKGDAWGTRLADHAVDHPVHPNGGERDILGTLRLLFRARDTNYTIMRRDYRVSDTTGELVPRPEGA